MSMLKSFLCAFLLALIITDCCFAQDVQNQKSLADSLNVFALKYRSSKRGEAFTSSKKAFKISQSIGYEKGENEARLNIAQYYVTGNRYDSCMHFLRQIDEKQLDAVHRALLYYYKGRVYASLTDFKRAEEHYQIAEKIFDANIPALLEKKELNDFVGGMPNSLGVLKFMQQKYNEALEFYLQALKIRTKHNLSRNKELYNIALVYGKMDNSRKALTFLNKAFAIAYDRSDTTALLHTANSIGNCYKNLKLFDSAAIFYDSALAMGKRLKRLDLSANALVNKAKLMDDLKKYTEAIALLHETITIARNFRQQPILSHALDQLGTSFYKLKNYDSAIYYEREAYKLTERSQYLPVLKTSAFALAGLFKDLHEMDSAYKYLEKHYKVDEQIDSLSNASQFSDLRVRIETLEKDQEISVLQSEQEVDRLKNQRMVLALAGLSILAASVVIGLFIRQKTQKRINAIEQAKMKAELEANRENLTKQTLGMININNCLDEIQEQVKDLITSQSDIRLARVVNLIKANKTLQNDWENFNKYFGSVHASFYEKLTSLDLQLSTHEKRICALIKLNLTNREIATLLNIETTSVKTMKYRIKKKLSLDESNDLETYLMQLA
jgi:tetratricopeptide (TPR) repeat protein/DNA-binding CsgD family transcriptional regulator